MSCFRPLAAFSSVLIGIMVAVLALPCPASAASYIRDEIRVNMRSGSGLEFKIIELLTSGDQVRRLETQGNWVLVRAASGLEGWVPKGYVTSTPPASVALPATQAKLTQANGKIEELTKKLATQAAAIKEINELRESNEALSTRVSELTWSSGWKSMATGAAIIVFGMIIGLLVPRGSAARNRLKL